MRNWKLGAVIVLAVLYAGQIGHAQGITITYERYLLAGNLNNSGTAGGPVVTNENFSLVTLPNGKQVADNSMHSWESPEALRNMRAQIPPSLRSVRVAAWMKTREARGIIRKLFGTGMWGDRELPTGVTLSLSRGRLAWDTCGHNARNHSIRGVRRVNDGRWHHVAAVSQLADYPWSMVALYMDGQLDAWYVWYDSNMTPPQVQTDAAFGFPGQMSLLEFQNLEAGPRYFTGSGEDIQPVERDPLYDAATIPLAEPAAPPTQQRTTSSSVVSVEDYGAAGNGIVDDTGALLQAVAALDPEQGIDTLFLPEGTYEISQALRLPNGVDMVGLGATIRRQGGPAVELVGEVSDISLRGIRFDGSLPAAIHQYGGTARHLYFERCDFWAPGEGPVPNDANDYRLRRGDGVLFTDVRDTTILGCTATCGRAGIAVEGHMENLSIIRCLIQHSSSLTGFYFDALNSGPALLLNNTVNCNMGYALTARAVQDLVVRGLSTEGMGVSLPAEAPTGPMYDIRNGTRVDLELISLANLQLGRPGYQHQTWEGPQLRINGQDNTVAAAALFAEGPDPYGGLRDATLESDDPNLVLWQLLFGRANLALSGAADKRVVMASRFIEGEYPAVIFRGESREALATEYLPVSPEKRVDPTIWGPPAPRFTWGELGLKSVRDYGAEGDGRTDDTQAFQRAAALSGLVYVPEGIYRLTGSVAAPMMLGDGAERSIVVTGENSPGIVRFPRDMTVHHGTVADITLRRGEYGVYIPGNTSGWFVSRVRFENPRIAGFAADSLDHGNVLVDCEFIGGQYGFIAGGWNRHFVDKTTLWRCTFDGQTENGIRIASVDGSPGLFLHTMLRDCTVRNTGGSGIVMMGHVALYNFLDHCLIENCGQRHGAPYVSFIRSGNATALMYHSRVVHTQGPQPPVLVDVEGHHYMRFVDVELVGAEGAVALRSRSAQAWLERVTAEGSLQAPEGTRIIYADTQVGGAGAASSGENGLWLVERSHFAGAGTF